MSDFFDTLGEQDFFDTLEVEEQEPLGDFFDSIQVNTAPDPLVEETTRVEPNPSPKYGQSNYTIIHTVPRKVGGGYTEIRQTPGMGYTPDPSEVSEEGPPVGGKLAMSGMKPYVRPPQAIDLSKTEVRVYRPDVVKERVPIKFEKQLNPLPGGRSREVSVPVEYKTVEKENTFNPLTETVEEVGRAVVAEQFRIPDAVLGIVGAPTIGGQLLSEPERTEVLGEDKLLSIRTAVGLPGDLLAFKGLGTAAKATGATQFLKRQTPALRKLASKGLKGVGIKLKEKPFHEFVTERGGIDRNESVLKDIAKEALERGYPLEGILPRDLQNLYIQSVSSVGKGRGGIMPSINESKVLLADKLPKDLSTINKLQNFTDRQIINWSDDTHGLSIIKRYLANPEVAKEVSTLLEKAELRLQDPQEIIKYYRGAAQGQLEYKHTVELPKIIKRAKEAGASYERFEQYAYWKRLEDITIKQIQKTPVNQTGPLKKKAHHIRKLLKDIEETTPDFNKLEMARRDLVDFNHASGKQLVAKTPNAPGFILEDEWQRIKSQNPEFVKFSAMETPVESGQDLGQRAARNATGKKRGKIIRKYRPGEQDIDDVIYSSVMQDTAITEATAHNSMLFETWGSLRDLPGIQDFIKVHKPVVRPVTVSFKEIESQLDRIASSVTENERYEELIKVFRPNFGGARDDMLKIYVGGKPVHLEVTPLGKELGLMEALSPVKGMRGGGNSLLLQFARASARMLRLGATGLNWEFTLRNLPRDAQTAFLQTGSSSWKYVMNFPKALAETVGKGKSYNDWLKAGGGFGGQLAQDKRRYFLEMKILSGGKREYLKHPIETLREIIGMSERVSRLAEYKSRLADYARMGMSIDDSKRLAVRDAQEVTLNFGTAGIKGREWNKTSAFFNAGVRDISKIMEMYKKHPVRTASRSFATVTAPSVTLWWLNKDNPLYQAISDTLKQYFYHIPKSLFGVEDIENPFWTFPRPFGHGVIAGYSVEQMLNYWVKNDPDAVSRLGQAVWSQGAPNVMPTVAQVALSAIGDTGFDLYRDRPVLSHGDTRLLPHAQRDPWGSQTIQGISGLMRSLPPEADNNFLDIMRSPKRLEHVLRAQFGGIAKWGLKASDAIGQQVQLFDTPEDHRGVFSGISKSLQDKFFEQAELGSKTYATMEDYLNKQDINRYNSEISRDDIKKGLRYNATYNGSGAREVARLMIDNIYQLTERGKIKEARVMSQRLNDFYKRVIAAANKERKGESTVPPQSHPFWNTMGKPEAPEQDFFDTLGLK